MDTVSKDAEHLRLLSIFHYVLGGFQALVSLIPVIHLLMGLSMVFSPETWCRADGGNCPPPFFGWIFALIGGGLVLGGLLFAAGMILNGRFMAQRKHHAACLVISGVECLAMPLGTVLGVFSLIVLTRPSVKSMFGVGDSSTGG